MKIFDEYCLVVQQGAKFVRDEGFSHSKQTTPNNVHRWLREEKRIRVFVEQKTGGDFGFVIYTPNKPEQAAGQPWIRHSHFMEHFATYEQALCAGINEGVELIGKPEER
jgi:hypothetical protein